MNEKIRNLFTGIIGGIILCFCFKRNYRSIIRLFFKGRSNNYRGHITATAEDILFDKVGEDIQRCIKSADRLGE